MGFPRWRHERPGLLAVFVQILLHRFTDWRADMKTAGRGWRLCVHFTLLACLGLTGAWLVGWVGLQLGLVLVDFGQVDVRVRRRGRCGRRGTTVGGRSVFEARPGAPTPRPAHACARARGNPCGGKAMTMSAISLGGTVRPDVQVCAPGNYCLERSLRCANLGSAGGVSEESSPNPCVMLTTTLFTPDHAWPGCPVDHHGLSSDQSPCCCAGSSALVPARAACEISESVPFVGLFFVVGDAVNGLGCAPPESLWFLIASP